MPSRERETLDRQVFYGATLGHDGILLGHVQFNDLLRSQLVQVGWRTPDGVLLPYSPGECGHAGHERIFRVVIKYAPIDPLSFDDPVTFRAK